ncbi:MAG: hypothetical protein LBE18_09195 [Planctomycetaceae bacterium]|nr:hypothetical protein [Planctomycetaceae bacterium]
MNHTVSPLAAAAVAVDSHTQKQTKSRENHNSEFQPLEEYAKLYKDLHKKNVSEFLEDLIKKSGVDEKENQRTVKKINLLKDAINGQKKILSEEKRKQNRLTFLIIISVIVFIVSIIFLSGNADDFIAQNSWDKSMTDFVFVLALFAAIFLFSWSVSAIRRWIIPKIKELQIGIAGLKKQLKPILKLARSQMSPLNEMFRHYMSSRLMEQTYPLIQFDDYFDIKRFDYLHRKYGLKDNKNNNVSTLFTQSGEINGNPFCFFYTLNHRLGKKTYTGSLTVYWTEQETYTDSNRNTRYRTVQKQETLYANVTKPCPRYYNRFFLVYGNEAAPNLSFSREAADTEILTEKQLQETVNSEIKKINTQMRKAIARGENFTSMANEFDALFAATNRNNEVEFRLLFTPIAQREMIKLLKDTTYSWGDDFNFTKTKMINTIESEHLLASKTIGKSAHLQWRDISGDPKNYQHYDLNTIRTNFNYYNNEYFRAVYFAFAPLLAIPIYQQYKPHEFIYKDIYQSRFCCFAHEYAVNKMGTAKFNPSDCETATILKTECYSTNGIDDNINVTAYGYKTYQQVDYVSVYFRGHNYNVPVAWTEYIPIQETTSVSITELDV